MTARKEISTDLRVVEAIEALKRTVLAVNGDQSVVSTVVLVDVRTADGEGMIAQRFDVCPCPQCVGRISNLLHMGLADVKKEQRRQIRQRGAVH